MSDTSSRVDPPASRSDLRELEARLDARLQAVSARFVRVDNRFAGVDTRLDEAERRHHSFDQDTSTHLTVVDSGLESLGVRVDDAHAQLGYLTQRHGATEQRIAQLGRRILVAVVVHTLVTVALWSATVTVILMSRPG